MRRFTLLLLAAVSVLKGQDISATLVTTSGETPLGSPYVFGATAVNSSSTAVIRLRNASGNPLMIAAVMAATTSSATTPEPDFTVTNLAALKILASGDATSYEDFTLTFVPQSTGLLTASLEITYQVQQNGCQFQTQTVSQQCQSSTDSAAILQGTGTPSQLVLTYQSAAGSVALQPGGTTPLDFGSVSTSSSKTITFTLANQGSTTLQTPSVNLQTVVNDSSAFSLSTSGLSQTIAAGGSTSFSVTFAPGQAAQSNATLQVGGNTYPLSGTGIIAGGLDALVIDYVDSTGVRLLAQGTTPIDFGQIVAGSTTPNTLTFIATNPTSSFDSLTVPSIVASGSGFSVNGAPAMPALIAPGQSITFKVLFAPSQAGTFTGALAIGTRQFLLTGIATQPALDLSLSVDLNPLTSQQQAHVSVQSSTAASTVAIGQLAMTFTPSVSGISDDPAVVFTATGGRQLQVTIAQGQQTGTYNGQSQLTFQTGATAGTITFTLTFPNEPVITKSFAITPAAVQISSGSAVREASSLVVSLTGFDNTYSAGSLSFTFYDINGKQINAAPITSDATSVFHDYFFGQTTAGGAFTLQATFPVSGDPTQVGSVSISLGNSSGASTVSETFQ